MASTESLNLSEIDTAAAMADGLGVAPGKDLEAIYDIPVRISAVLGRTNMPVSQLLKLGRAPWWSWTARWGTRSTSTSTTA